MDEKSIWTEFISERMARNVARALREAGYGTATIGKCRGYAINVAQYFEPRDHAARDHLLDLICKAAGIQPRRV